MRHLGSLLAVLFAAAVLAAGCAPSQSQDVCNKTCDMQLTCGTLPPGNEGVCKAACGSDQNALTTCSNDTAIVDCQNTCLAKTDCTAYQTCITACPACMH